MVDQEVPNRPEVVHELRPVEIAYLRGGSRAAVMTAVAGLHAHKAVTLLGKGRLSATGVDPTTRVTALEYAVLRALRQPTTFGALRSATGVRHQLHLIDHRLRTHGLLPTVRHRVLWWLNRRTDAGETVLAWLREKHGDLDPGRQSAWRPREPHLAAMSVALFGSDAMPPTSSGERGSGRSTAVDGGAIGGAG